MVRWVIFLLRTSNSSTPKTMTVPTRAKSYIVLNRVYIWAEDQSCDSP